MKEVFKWQQQHNNGVFQWISEPKLGFFFENALVRGT